ncbi:hypothetical protein ABEY61_30190 [Bacillus toyonensis]|uniref:hypothetical protein n=1 Tax=Bacillus toyonensis TaxID=155322 RepID=UPI003D208BB8
MNSEIVIFILTIVRDFLIGKAMEHILSLERTAYEVLIVIGVLYIILPSILRLADHFKSL